MGARSVIHCVQHPARSRAAGWVRFASQAPARFAPELSQARQDRPRPVGRTSGPRRLSGPFFWLMVEAMSTIVRRKSSQLVYSCSPSTIPSTCFGAAPLVFSREARLAILATHGVLGARVPLHPRPSACRRVRPRRCVCQLAPLHEGRRFVEEAAYVRGYDAGSNAWEIERLYRHPR